MSVSFDWDFREEDDDEPWEQEDAHSPDRRSRWLRRGVVVLILLVIAGLAAHTWAKHRLDAIKKVENELRKIVELELKNITDGDVELFRALQDPTVFGWRDQQVACYIPDLSEGLRGSGFAPAPGLTPADRPLEIEHVRVFGRTGRVKLARWFQPVPLLPARHATAPANFLTTWSHPVPFHVTWFYRLDEDGTWYHTPPPDGYRGISYSWHSERFVVYATEIEAEAMDAIAYDLFAVVFGGCRLFDCPEDGPYILSFDDVLAPELRGKRWSLPALHLAGIPEDAVTRAAWTHAMKLWLVETLVQTQTEYEGFADRIVYRQLVARIQAELDLIELPSPDAEILRQARRQDEQRPLWSLWQARYNPDDPQEARLLEAEVIVLLQLIESRVGSKRLFELVPALDDYDRLSDALSDLYGLESLDFVVDWNAQLTALTGVGSVSSLVSISTQSDNSYYLYTGPLPSPTLPPTPPGDQIALTCDDQILVGNMDGSNIVPLTPDGYRFTTPLWSPDGRWLLAVWQLRAAPNALNVLYLLAADGSQVRPLTTNEPMASLWPIGWSPDGRWAYYAGDGGTSDVVEMEVWFVDVETGETRQLPGLPVWSPDGQRLVYADGWLDFQGNAVWLADADWENAHQIADRAWVGSGEAWSPDSSRLVLVSIYRQPGDHAIAIYDLATEDLTPLITLADAREAILSSEGGELTRHADPAAALEDSPLWGFGAGGWSADGSHLIVSTLGTGNVTDALEAILVVSLDGSPPRVLAFADQGERVGASWSPTDPNRLIFGQQASNGMSFTLFDLKSGPVYTTTQAQNAVWSPDGDWIAFIGSQITIVDQQGQSRFALPHPCGLTELAWNPAADLTLDFECYPGRDLWIAEQDVYYTGDTLVVAVHNSGDQETRGRLVLLITEDQSGRVLAHYNYDSVNVPPCGSLLLYLDVRNFTGPVTLSVNPPNEQYTLLEDDYGNNQVTLRLSEP